MLKNLATVGVIGVLLLSAVVANADVMPDGRLKLTIMADGQAYITNTSTGLVRIDGYEISSLAGLLNPSPKSGPVWNPDDEVDVYTTLCVPDVAWSSMEDRFYVGGTYESALTGTATSQANIGTTNTKFFVEMSNTTHMITESNTAGAAIVRVAGTYAPIPLGKITNLPTLGDISFVYTLTTTSGGVPGNSYMGQVEILPEPATMCLLAIGGVSMLIRKRRRS